MSENPLFTIATVTHNSGQWIGQAIQSVLASTYTNFEFLISDDCSSDDTWEIVQQYNDPRIRAWRNETNIGEYPNRNKALNEARGRFILYLDGDDILYKDSLAEYARYADSFPDASGIWGVHSVFFDFVAFPYLFTPIQLTSLNFLSTYPVTVVGFTDSVFGVPELKSLGGLDERFAIGDTYIKRKFSCRYCVLLVPAGRAFWRQHPQQASRRVRDNYRNLIEAYQIDKELLSSEDFPLKGPEWETARTNFRIRSVKLLILNTIKRGRIVDFVRLMSLLNIPYADVLLALRRGDYRYTAGASSVDPLINEYHFN